MIKYYYIEVNVEENYRIMNKNRKGFTLVELLAVIIILAIIMIIAIPTILGIISQSRENSMKRTAQQMARAASLKMSTQDTNESFPCWINFTDLDMESDSDPFGNDGYTGGVQVNRVSGTGDNSRFEFSVVLRGTGKMLISGTGANNQVVPRAQLANSGNAEVVDSTGTAPLSGTTTCW